MARKIPSIGEWETRILQLVWEHEPCTERQISDLAQVQRDVARTTVLKTLQRLETKGLLRREPGRPAMYRAVFEEGHVLPELVRRFVDGVLGGSSEPLVAYLAGQERLSAQDVRALKRIAGKMGDGAVNPARRKSDG
jgi:BlaI family transcriptional regulator, penicillinase repressor